MLIKKCAIATNIKTDRNLKVSEDTDVEVGSKIVLLNGGLYKVETIISDEHILVSPA